MAIWQLVAVAGGTTGMVLGLGAYFLIPEMCEPVTLPGLGLVLEYNCFNAGAASRAEWSFYIGGLAALVAAGISAVTKKSTR
jgi:hypothetical protein